MLKPVPQRITYAQEKLLNLVKERKLKKWCVENSFTHTSIYRLAVGDTLPTYRLISSMSHLISPIEWFYYTDEKIPYKVQLVPQWDYRRISKFVKEHKFDYRVIADKYGIEELTAYNLLVAYRSYPTIDFIKRASADYNPLDFFTESNIEVPRTFIPERGNIVNIKGALYLALTKQDFNKEHNFLTACRIVANCKDGVALEESDTKGFVNPADLHSFEFNYSNTKASLPSLIESVNPQITKEVLNRIKETLK